MQKILTNIGVITQVYMDAQMQTNMWVMTQLVIVERRVLTRSLHKVPEVYKQFILQRFDCFSSYYSDTGYRPSIRIM